MRLMEEFAHLVHTALQALRTQKEYYALLAPITLNFGQPTSHGVSLVMEASHVHS